MEGTRLLSAIDEEAAEPQMHQAADSGLEDGLFPEWQDRVYQHQWYCASPFAYCVAGGLLLLRPEPLERGLPLFPWRCTGLGIVLNGFLSYMADVETWGRPSAWKMADRVLAVTNTLLQVCVVALSCLGYSHFPIESPSCLGIGVLLALVCKQRSSAAMSRADCDAYLMWHSLWHYILPSGAILGQLVLHRSCDYALLPPWGQGNCAMQDMSSRTMQ